MKPSQTAPRDIDQYIASFPEEVQQILQKIRATIRQAAPDAEETIKYQMPTFTLHGNLVHFAAYTKHIGFYPVPRGNALFEDELSAYASGRGTARFPLDKPIPFDLISRIVEFRVKATYQAKAAKKKG
jgi:uncharacterized protein YdhG (YjbR/CyaY superfamily)